MKKRVIEEVSKEAAMMDLRVNLKIAVNLQIDFSREDGKKGKQDEDQFRFPLKKNLKIDLLSPENGKKKRRTEALAVGIAEDDGKKKRRTEALAVGIAEDDHGANAEDERSEVDDDGDVVRVDPDNEAPEIEAPEIEQGLKAAPVLNKFLQVFLQVLVDDWGLKFGTYKLTRKLFGATCKACHDRVQAAVISQNWFHRYCPFNPSPQRCRFCDQLICGLLFWQCNGVAHYGCLDKKKAYDKMAPRQEETYKALKWGFPGRNAIGATGQKKASEED